jgi:hypothetical protein
LASSFARLHHDTDHERADDRADAGAARATRRSDQRADHQPHRQAQRQAGVYAHGADEHVERAGPSLVHSVTATAAAMIVDPTSNIVMRVDRPRTRRTRLVAISSAIASTRDRASA